MKVKLLLPALLFSVSCFSQKDFNTLLLKIDNELESHSEKFPVEHIGLLSDKQEYLAGENIYLSCFLQVNGKPSFLSRTVYVEFGDASGKIIDKKMVSVEKGASHVVMPVPLNLSSGVYWINAYSLWMKNFPEKIAQKPIVVLNADYAREPFLFRSEKQALANAEWQAEGNSWVEGEEKLFVLRLSDKNGVPFTGGFSITENGKELIKSQSDSNGLARLTLKPVKNAVYTVQAGSQRLPLQLPRQEGVGITINGENKARLFVSISKSKAVPSQKFLLVGTDQERVCFQAVFNFSEAATATAISKSKLPQGLLKFYLFDEEHRIVAQRNYYHFTPVQPVKEINLENNLILRIDTSLHNGILAVTIPASQHLLGAFNHISLMPELQNAYWAQVPDLSAASLQTIDNICILMPSAQVGSEWQLHDQPLKYIVESGIAVKGIVMPYAGKANPQGYKAELIIKGEDSSTTLSSVQTLPNGEFIIPDLKFQKAARIYFQGNNAANGKELLDMRLYPSYLDTLKSMSRLPGMQYEKYAANSKQTAEVQKQFEAYSENNQYKALEAVVIKAKVRSRTDSLKQEYLTPLFADGNAQIIEPEGHFISFWHFLRGRVAGVRVEGNLDNPQVFLSRNMGTITATNSSGEDLSESFGESEGIVYYLNEVQVSKDVVSTLNTNDIALVVVNKEPMAALGAYNGMIAIFTKKGVALGNTVSKSMAHEKRLGYSDFNRNFQLNREAFKPGSSVYFGRPRPNINITLPASFTYKYVVAGWNSNNEFVFGVR